MKLYLKNPFLCVTWFPHLLGNFVLPFVSSEPKEIIEKSKTPSRRNSRTEEPTVASESVENGHRKRSSRPASASSSTKG